ncbi:TIGR00730 family Rossman fold protein, partial [Pseudomonas sp. MWU13-2625]
HEFWTGLLDWVKDRLVSEGMINPDDLNLIQLIDDPQQIVDTIFKHYETRCFDALPEERDQLLNL